jgi:integrase
VRGSKKEISPGVWKLRVYAGRRPNGTPIQVTKTVHAPERKPGAGARLADRELAKLVSDVSAGKVSAGRETVGTLLDLWLNHCESIGHSPTTMRKYRQLAEAVVRPELGSVRLSKLTARQLDSLYSKLTARGNKPLTVRRLHTVISAMLAQGERWNMVDNNVARKAGPPPVHMEQIKSPSVEQVRAIITEAEKVEPMLGALLFIGALTGARRGELCALRWSDLDWQAGVLAIGRSVYDTKGGGWGEKPTKTHQVRRVGLDEVALEVLRGHRAQVDQLAENLGLKVPPDAFIFSRSPVGSEPVRPEVVTSFVPRIARAAGVNTHLHALRHFSATQLIAAGHDVRTVAGRLGHADAAVTLRVYSHVLPERDREAAAALGRTLALPT